VAVEYRRVLPVPSVLLPGVSVTVGGVVTFEPVGCTGSRFVVQDVCGGAIAHDQDSAAGRANRKALCAIVRQVLFEYRQRGAQQTVVGLQHRLDDGRYGHDPVPFVATGRVLVSGGRRHPGRRALGGVAARVPLVRRPGPGGRMHGAHLRRSRAQKCRQGPVEVRISMVLTPVRVRVSRWPACPRTLGRRRAWAR